MKKLTIEEIRKMEKSVLSVHEAAAAMGISRPTFYKNIDKMKFPIDRIGRKYVIPKEAFIEYLRSGKCEENKRNRLRRFIK